MKKTLIFGALAAAGMIAAPSAQAALAADAQLLMGPQDGFCDFDLGTYPDSCTVAAIPSANFFAMDNDGSGSFENSERVGIDAGLDGGIILGKTQVEGDVDSVWGFFGADGWHKQAGTLSVSSTAGGNATINMTGWTVNWNNGDIDMGQGADAVIVCSGGDSNCGAGSDFTLDYTAIVPDGQFAGVAYQLHLSGTIGGVTPAIPVPAAVWLFGSGLLGLVGVARRRKAA